DASEVWAEMDGFTVEERPLELRAADNWHDGGQSFLNPNARVGCLECQAQPFEGRRLHLVACDPLVSVSIAAYRIDAMGVAIQYPREILFRPKPEPADTLFRGVFSISVRVIS